MSFDLPYYLGFSAFPGIGPARFKLLLEYFGSAKRAWNAPEKELYAIHLPKNILEEFLHFRKTFDLPLYREHLAANHINTLIGTDEKYPKLLKEISDPPIVLYVKGKKGETPVDMERTIAVVGTRQATPYGRDVTERIVAELVDNGFTIVSGMAYGIDAVAHTTAIKKNGKTIAVLGCGPDIIAPPVNAPIYHALTEDSFGAVVSEMPLGMRPNKGLFPSRNRIISGLSLGVLVTEGADDSGALITARYAAEQGRDVFAVPGPITSQFSKGPSLLLKQGAVLVESAEDIINALHLSHLPPHSGGQKRKGNTPEEEKILKLLSCTPLHVDDIVRKCGLTISSVLATLTVLEMEGVVKDTGGKVYELQ